MSRINTLNAKRIVAVFMAVVMMILSLSYTGNNQTDATNTSRRYYIYDAKTLNKIGNYTLDTVESSNNTRAVIGDNNNMEESWNKNRKDTVGIVKLMDGEKYFGKESDSYLGTGFVVSPHVIATAGHCVYNIYSNKLYEMKEILLFDNKGNITLRVKPSQIHIPEKYIQKEQPDYDYALITVKEDLSDYDCFNLGVSLNSCIYNKAKVTVSGFPSYTLEDNGEVIYVNDNVCHAMYSAEGEMCDNTRFDKNYLITYTADMCSGQSGGPVYIIEPVPQKNNEAYYTVIGINIANPVGPNPEYNIGTRITTDLIHFYTGNNKNINW